MFTLNGKFTNATVYTDNIEQEAVGQIVNVINHPVSTNSKIAIMPDAHAGAGCTIGTTMTITDRVCANLVGVDIGCGMLTIKLGKVDIDFKRFDEIVNQKVPAGFEVHPNETRFSNTSIKLEDLHCFSKLRNISHIKASLGTLGGGNHFIELDKDDEGNVYLVIHTGSRNLGKQVAEYYQNLAYEKAQQKYLLSKDEEKSIIESLKSEGRQIEIADTLKKIREKQKSEMPNIVKDLCYLVDEDMNNYLNDVELCQRFAHDNRLQIAQTICDNYFGFGSWSFEMFETIHNYIDTKSPTKILRKGAVSAQNGETLLIPINMRDGSLICKGKGNPDWNYSAPHGAGRLMSRSSAKASISLEEFEKAMEGVYSTSVGTSTIDESPMAYKSIDDIINNIGDTVDIISIIKPIYNFKAH